MLVTSSLNNVVRVWDAKSGKEITLMKVRESFLLPLNRQRSFSVTAVGATFSPDGNHLVTNSYDVAQIWHTQSGKLEVELSGHTYSVEHAEFSPDGKLVVTASLDKTARIWDSRNGNLLRILEGHTGAVMSARFNADGNFVITASSDESIRIWHTKSGVEILAIRGHGAGVNFASFNPKTNRVASASRDWTSRIWNLPYYFSASRTSKNLWSTGSKHETSFHNNTEAYIFSTAAKTIPRCLTSEQRKDYNLRPDPPCWCQEKAYPTLEMWEDDYLSRHPEIDQSDKNGKWPDGVAKPNPFTHEREDGWTCPTKGEGYSAPWNDYEDLKALTPREILGPVDEAYARLDELGITP